MAQFYGRIEGNRGDVTRLGSKVSGLEVQAMAWGGIVDVRLHHRDGEDVVTVYLRPHPKDYAHSARNGIVLYDGPVNGWKNGKGLI